MPGNSRSRQKRKPKLEPISYEEMLGAAGMSGFVSFLDITPSDGEQSAIDLSTSSTELVSASTPPSFERDAKKPGTPDSGVLHPSSVYPLEHHIDASAFTSTPPTIPPFLAVAGKGTPVVQDVAISAPVKGIPANIHQAPYTERHDEPNHVFTTDNDETQQQPDIISGVPQEGILNGTESNTGIPASGGKSNSDHYSPIELIEGQHQKAAQPQGVYDDGIPDIGIPRNNKAIIGQTTSAADPVFPRHSTSPVLVAHGTDSDRHLTSGPILSRIPDSGIPNKPLIPIAPYATSIIPRAHRLRRATRVQDGHSLGEQALYDALWQAAQPYSADARIIMVGYRRMSELARLTVNNCKANIRALIQKLAVDEAAPFSHSQGTTYVVYNFSAILQRRKTAGLTFYIRSRGVVFVDPETGLPLTSSTHSKSGTPDRGWSRPISIPESDNKGIPIADTSGVPEAAPHKERKTISQQAIETSSTFSLPENLIQAFHQILPAIDNDAITTIWNECRARAEDCTVEEIVYFAKSKAIALNNGKIQNPVGFLLAAVPKCFEGQTFQIFRREEARRRQERQRREEEEREERLQFEEQNRREAEAYRKAEVALINLSQIEQTALYDLVKSDLKRNYPYINWPNREALEARIRIGMIRELQKRV